MNFAIRGLIFSRYKTQSYFAEHIGWTKQKLSKILLGRQEPTVTDLNDMAKGLDCSAEKLIHIFLSEKSPIG